MGSSQTACRGSASNGPTRRGQRPEALGDHARPAQQAQQVVHDQPEALAAVQWNVSSMVCGDRCTQRWSMSMAANSARNGASPGRCGGHGPASRRRSRTRPGRAARPGGGRWSTCPPRCRRRSSRRAAVGHAGPRHCGSGTGSVRILSGTSARSDQAGEAAQRVVQAQPGQRHHGPPADHRGRRPHRGGHRQVDQLGPAELADLALPARPRTRPRPRTTRPVCSDHAAPRRLPLGDDHGVGEPEQARRRSWPPPERRRRCRPHHGGGHPLALPGQSIASAQTRCGSART